MSFLKSAFRRLPVPSTNYLWRRFAVNPYDLLKAPNPVIYDIGSRDARGRYAFGAPPAGAKLLCVDIAPGPGVDVVADAHDLGIVPDGSVDCVLAVGVLLHCKFPQQVIDEFYRVLRPNGVVYISSPFVFTRCEPPDDYYHFSIKGLEFLCRRFSRLDSGYNRGPAATMCHLLVEFLSILFCFNSQVLYRLAFFFFSWLLFWVKYLDAIIGGYRQAGILYSGAYFIGRKLA
jgi:SAM-dependent methyltransferase